MSASRQRLIVFNIIGYQLVWMTCVWGAGNGAPLAGPAVAFLFVLATVAAGGTPAADLRALAMVLPVGIALDSAFAAVGLLTYAEQPWVPLAPAWIWAIWAAFALTLNHSLAFLARRPWLAAGLGLVAGPLAYWSAASAFHAIQFAVPVPLAVIVVGLAWALLLPALMTVNQRLSNAQVAQA